MCVLFYAWYKKGEREVIGILLLRLWWVWGVWKWWRKKDALCLGESLIYNFTIWKGICLLAIELESVHALTIFLSDVIFGFYRCCHKYQI